MLWQEMDLSTGDTILETGEEKDGRIIRRLHRWPQIFGVEKYRLA
jgi:hypothetical protein